MSRKRRSITDPTADEADYNLRHDDSHDAREQQARNARRLLADAARNARIRAMHEAAKTTSDNGGEAA